MSEHCRTGLVSLAVLVLPVEVAVPAEATLDPPGRQVTIDLLGGGGSYAVIQRYWSGRELAAPLEAPYGEVSGAVEVEDGPFRVGVRMGNVWTEQQPGTSTTWFNPHFAVAWKAFGFGAGPLIGANDLPDIQPPTPRGTTDSTSFWYVADLPDAEHDAPPFSGHLWGGTRALNLRVSFMESAPLISGGGYSRLGLRIHPKDRFDLFAGVSTGPFDRNGFFANLDVPVDERMSLLTRVRVGSSLGEAETGLALGLRWRATSRPRSPRGSARTSSSRSPARTLPRR
jgi:hypothetical protein